MNSINRLPAETKTVYTYIDIDELEFKFDGFELDLMEVILDQVSPKLHPYQVGDLYPRENTLAKREVLAADTTGLTITSDSDGGAMYLSICITQVLDLAEEPKETYSKRLKNMLTLKEESDKKAKEKIEELQKQLEQLKK
jgi:hypothetical protein